MAEVSKLAAPAELTLLGEVHPLLQQLGSCDGLVTFDGLAELMNGGRVKDLPSLRKFLSIYEQDILFAFELPLILQAYHFAVNGQLRELVALDGQAAAHSLPLDLESASRRVGRNHLQRLRPLRDQRLVQRYLKAVDDGHAQGWHTIVYGITLGVYSLPVRQGLILYCLQTLDGFVRAAGKPLRLTAADCRELLDTFSANVPARVEEVLKLPPR